mmetsp:Transcript_6489/g.12598  ORF Transcript_6489/g.12598 Transcript_6489/m.12598 type:complete len:232 (+) Transcript_6489:2132-2827(+)
MVGSGSGDGDADRDDGRDDDRDRDDHDDRDHDRGHDGGASPSGDRRRRHHHRGGPDRHTTSDRDHDRRDRDRRVRDRLWRWWWSPHHGSANRLLRRRRDHRRDFPIGSVWRWRWREEENRTDGAGSDRCLRLVLVFLYRRYRRAGSPVRTRPPAFFGCRFFCFTLRCLLFWRYASTSTPSVISFKRQLEESSRVVEEAPFNFSHVDVMCRCRCRSLPACVAIGSAAAARTY